MKRKLLSGVAIIAALAGGWWQWRADTEIISDRDRIAALEGVAAVAYEPVHPYEITLEPGLSTDQIRDVLAETSSILSSTDDSAVYPMAFLLIGHDEFYVDLSSDAARTAAIVTATDVPHAVSADVDFDPDSLGRLTFGNYQDVLPGARQLRQFHRGDPGPHPARPRERLSRQKLELATAAVKRVWCWGPPTPRPPSGWQFPAGSSRGGDC